MNVTGASFAGPRSAVRVAPSASGSISTAKTFGSPSPSGTAGVASSSAASGQLGGSPHLGRAARAVPAVEERLGERADDDGPLVLPPQERKSHQTTSPGRSSTSAPPTSGSIPFTK